MDRLIALDRKTKQLKKSIQVFQKGYQFKKDLNLKYDSAEYIKVSDKIICNSIEIDRLNSEMDSLNIIFVHLTDDDSLLSSGYLSAKKLFTENTITFKSIMPSQDNSVILPFWIEVQKSYSAARQALTFKNANLGLLQKRYNEANEKLNLLQTDYNSQVDLLNRLFAYTHDSSATLIQFNKLQVSLYNEFISAIVMTKKYQVLNVRLNEFNDNYNSLIKTSRSSGSIAGFKYFITFVNELYSTQKRLYNNEKKLIHQVKNNSERCLNKINNKLSVYNKNEITDKN